WRLHSQARARRVPARGALGMIPILTTVDLTRSSNARRPCWARAAIARATSMSLSVAPARAGDDGPHPCSGAHRTFVATAQGRTHDRTGAPRHRHSATDVPRESTTPPGAMTQQERALDHALKGICRGC